MNGVFDPDLSLVRANKMEAFGRLAGGIAHDFNNVLTAIHMFAENLVRRDLGEAERRSIAEEIIHAADLGSSLTRQLLAFSRDRPVQLEDLDLNEVVGGMARLLYRLIGENIALETVCSAEPARIHADRGMMEQTIMNLVLNSRDAMPSGGRVCLRTAIVRDNASADGHWPGARRGSFVRLSVTDSGSGIEPALLPRIFEPLFTTKELGKGTGLGLATVFAIVEHHHGRIEVESSPGCGTSFHVHLPLADACPASPGQPPSMPARLGR
jgi:signal transduction histidine kinase